tara:strand:+ start:41 stop:607 length:567 start_codon:yes stop_codon:yes gene_type:complete
MFYLALKRMFDIIFSLIALSVFSPILLISAIIIFLQDGHNFIFAQNRIGQNGKVFKFYKLRSMKIETPNVESVSESQVKITKFGKIIRRINLDEFPQFYNVLIGDMSVIGPRPPIESQKNLLKLRLQNKSISLKPGLTGWAQVNSYDGMSDEKKAYFDGEYFKKMGFRMDTIIFFKTLIYFTKPPPSY